MGEMWCFVVFLEVLCVVVFGMSDVEVLIWVGEYAFESDVAFADVRERVVVGVKVVVSKFEVVE